MHNVNCNIDDYVIMLPQARKLHDLYINTIWGDVRITSNVENAAYAGARYASLYVSDYNSSNMNELIDKIDNRVKENLWKNGEGANITVNITSDKIDVTVVYPVKNLTYVAQTFFGKYYKAKSASVTSI